ncbi:23S rRNA (adenine(1618)-N(6))-methyltransferase [Vibrio sp. 10N.286.49.C2]|uniref:23S rRNA (adenine(1618)-N(6))-methyltransferase RlmF n=1 Tax=unclassified Vibrio TaxID=2614977 RepID=UPI000C81DFDF|nr:MULTISPECIES: 23S rRNA (adenine(1618)-N(6))-methyltransferase RlmF [unclassified Vibrio]PMH31625.1 23S rRNA (adenine(1618)-N(6))-methyltransferase [Vibrio sp. 10N.286.49.C2]PMH50647.1 23S rRNA (adenine(1618)-N(6))-methyltransferase [Vibrio sp. 10N.286.49.B1]PMH79314.1 23S rRNA (adenine(1618)-N(6))-methyltransferase [Vibrio sp. 10N.286.48.B7]
MKTQKNARPNHYKSNQTKHNDSGTPLVTIRNATGLHKNNRHHGRYDFDALVAALPELKSVMTQNPSGQDTIPFSDPAAVKLLNKALLLSEYDLDYWDIPDGFLCPPIPGRADYIHWINEHLTQDLSVAGAKIKVQALDIGVGANCIYPIIGAAQYHWNWVGSEIDPVAVASAKKIVSQNVKLANKIDVRLQSSANTIFDGVIQPGDFFVVTICNPPFHKSLEDAKQGSERKIKNLGLNRKQRGSEPATSAKTSLLNFGGQKAELWCPGGESAFVSKMANESQCYSNQVIWFSTLLSKKENIEPLTKQLEKLGVSEVVIQEMTQGQKISRFVAWTFMPKKQRAQFGKTLR